MNTLTRVRVKGIVLLVRYYTDKIYLCIKIVSTYVATQIDIGLILYFLYFYRTYTLN